MKVTLGKKLTVASMKQKQFKLVAPPGSQVSIAGTFNNWDPMANPMKDNPESGGYKTTLRLAPGRYEYKFVVNGEWCIDPNCPAGVSNDMGDMNSVVQL